jgi:diguanylate cyclase (GGDEF)-like protein
MTRERPLVCPGNRPLCADGSFHFFDMEIDRKRMTATVKKDGRKESTADLDESMSQSDGVQTRPDGSSATHQNSAVDDLLTDRLGFDSVVPEPIAALTCDEADSRFKTLPDIVFVIDNVGIILACLGGTPGELALPRRDLIGKLISECPIGDIGSQFVIAMAAARKSEDPVSLKYAMPGDDGAAHFEGHLSRSQNGGFVAVVRNLTQQADVGDDHHEGTEDGNTIAMLTATLDATADGILVMDLDGHYVASNRIFHDMWRIPKYMLHRGQESAVGKFALSQITNPAILMKKIDAINKSLEERSVDVVSFKDGRFFECISMPQLIDNRKVGRVWSFRDVTNRVKTERRIKYNAYHDTLTQLPNRALFQDRLAQEVAQAGRSGRNSALLLLDLDRFKTINDTLGHAAGDELLTAVAKRLNSRRRDGDTIARLGGDEFVLIVSGLRRKEDVAVIAEQLLDVLKPPILIADFDLHVSASIGIAMYPDDGNDGTSLLKSADMALYRAKELGRDNYQLFEPKLNQRAMERLVLEKDLHRAIHQGEFFLHYQPQYDLMTGDMRGVEALARWKQGNEIVSPAKFIPIAEESGLIVPLGSWVLEEATRQCVKFNSKRREALRICVNVSALQIQRPNFASEVAKVLQDAGLSPSNLVVELTESALMQNPEQGSYAMEQLQQMGVGIAMDDFGTGHSSLNYISVLPISMIKIDQAFVRNCAKRKADETILTAIITMGHALNMKVLAEGVETMEQEQILRAKGCEEVQGFLYSPPVSAEDLLEMLEKESGSI